MNKKIAPAMVTHQQGKTKRNITYQNFTTKAKISQIGMHIAWNILVGALICAVIILLMWIGSAGTDALKAIGI